MALLELPGKAPSLKLILSLLKQTSDVAVAVNWFLVHLASQDLRTYLQSKVQVCVPRGHKALYPGHQDCV